MSPRRSRETVELNLCLCFTARLWNVSVVGMDEIFPRPFSSRREAPRPFVCQSVVANRFLPFVTRVDPLANDAEINRGS